MSFFCVLTARAQSFEVKSVSLQKCDLSASKKYVLDSNLDTCALIKIQTDIPDLLFEGKVVQYRKTNSSYWVYVVGGTRNLTIYHSLLIPTDLKVSDFGMKQFVSAKTYSVSLSLPLEIETVLSLNKETRKLTVKRKQMLELGRKYDQAISLYMPLEKGAFYGINRDEKERAALKEASELGLPDATRAYYEHILNKSTFHCKEIEEQQSQYNIYLNWFYESYILPIDTEFGTKQYCVINVPIESLSPNLKSLLINLVYKFDKVLPDKAKRDSQGYLGHGIPRVSLSGDCLYGIMTVSNPHGMIDDPWFMKAKQIWGDILNIAKQIPNSEINYTN